MKTMYLRSINVTTSSARQNYLNSDEKQENLLAYTELKLDKHFKNINKELIIELPNELMGENYNEILNSYIDRFKVKTNYTNVAGAIHLNGTKTNLHMHLSYIDRTFEKKTNVYKKDRYLYTSGKQLKKKDYNEGNPQHILIKAGEPILDFSKIETSELEEYLKKLKDKSTANAEKFELRRRIISTTSTPHIESWSPCLESNINDLNIKKEITDSYKELFTDLNNQELMKRGYEEKYCSFSEFEELGYISLKKIGKVRDNKPNKVQKRVLKYNDYVHIYNNNITKILESDAKYDEKMKIINKVKDKRNEKVEKSHFIHFNFDIMLQNIKNCIEYMREKMEIIYEQINTNSIDAKGNGGKNREVSSRSDDIERENNRTHKMEM